MKKLFSILAITVLMVTMTSVTTLARGGHGHGNRVNPQPMYALCTVDGCEEIGPHQHDGYWYCSQSGWTGNYDVCTVEGCTEIGLHEHDGTYYYCQYYGTGRGCGRNWNR